MNNLLFRIVVYIVAFYATFPKHKTSVRLVGLGIIIAHLYKDYHKLNKWPYWCEIGGLVMGYILINNSNDLLLQYVGYLKLFAHFRQFILKDNIYYSYNSAILIGLLFYIEKYNV